jgi:hypothetical protein
MPDSLPPRRRVKGEGIRHVVFLVSNLDEKPRKPDKSSLELPDSLPKLLGAFLGHHQSA